MNYWIAPDGCDEGPGHAAQPFATLARAAAALRPGDTCLLRQGVYRETLRPHLSGEPGRPIVYRAHPGETVLLTGAEALNGWRQEADGCWSAPMEVDLDDGNQVFWDGVMLTEARWPNSAGDLLHPVRATATAGSATTLTDPAIPGHANSWQGATLWCCGGHKWICWAGTVTAYEPVSHTLTFDSQTAATHWYTPRQGSEYVLMGVRAALDAPGEWWLDRNAARLWLIPPSGGTPADHDVEAKARTAAIDLQDRHDIQVIGLHFQAGGVLTNAASRRLRLQELRGAYVAHSYRREVSDAAIVLDGEDHVVVGCEFAYSSGSVVRLRGRRHKLVNNYIHHGNYAGLWSGTLSLAGRRHVAAWNTVSHSGRDLVSVHRLAESLLEHNDLSHAGYLTHDLGITYGHDTDFAGTVIRRNHVHDCVAQGLAEGIYFDHCSHNVVVCENLIWNIPAMPIQVNNPAHFNLVAHNSCFATSTARSEITSFDHSHRQDLFGCRFVNNLVNGAFDLPDNAVVRDNLTDADPGYRDAAAGDFRLRPESPARNGGSGIDGLRPGARVDLGAVPQGQAAWAAGWDPERTADETVEWQRPACTGVNRLLNAAFEFSTAEGWTTSGKVAVVAGNGWGNAVSGTEAAPTGTSRHELQLTDQAAVEQTVDGLPARTRFRLSAWVRALDPGARLTLSVTGSGVAPAKEATAAMESATAQDLQPCVPCDEVGIRDRTGMGDKTGPCDGAGLFDQHGTGDVASPGNKTDSRDRTCPPAVHAVSTETQWVRLVLDFWTLAAPAAVTVRVGQDAAADLRGRVDNLGLVEADGSP